MVHRHSPAECSDADSFPPIGGGDVGWGKQGVSRLEDKTWQWWN